MSTIAETQYFDYVKKPEAKKVDEAQKLLDNALDSWANEHQKEKSDCPFAEKGKEYIAALRKLEASQESDTEALKANRDLLVKIAGELSFIQMAILKADIEASRADANKSPDEKNWDRAFKYFQDHPVAGFFPMIASGISLLWSNLWGKKKTETTTAETEEEEDDVHDVSSEDVSSEGAEQLDDTQSLQLDLPDGAKISSDIQTHRKSTGRAHTGIDVSGMPEGTPLFTPYAKGRVLHTYTEVEKPTNGNCVYIQYKVKNKVYVFCFLHLQEPSPLVKNSIVEGGKMLGKVGHTGHVIAGKGGHGDHLHFQVYEGGKIVDPMPFLPAKNKTELVTRREQSAKKDAFWTA